MATLNQCFSLAAIRNNVVGSLSVLDAAHVVATSQEAKYAVAFFSEGLAFAATRPSSSFSAIPQLSVGAWKKLWELCAASLPSDHDYLCPSSQDTHERCSCCCDPGIWACADSVSILLCKLMHPDDDAEVGDECSEYDEEGLRRAKDEIMEHIESHCDDFFSEDCLGELENLTMPYHSIYVSQYYEDHCVFPGKFHWESALDFFNKLLSATSSQGDYSRIKYVPAERQLEIVPSLYATAVLLAHAQFACVLSDWNVQDAEEAIFTIQALVLLADERLALIHAITTGPKVFAKGQLRALCFLHGATVFVDASPVVLLKLTRSSSGYGKWQNSEDLREGGILKIALDQDFVAEQKHEFASGTQALPWPLAHEHDGEGGPGSWECTFLSHEDDSDVAESKRNAKDLAARILRTVSNNTAQPLLANALGRATAGEDMQEGVDLIGQVIDDSIIHSEPGVARDSDLLPIQADAEWADGIARRISADALHAGDPDIAAAPFTSDFEKVYLLLLTRHPLAVEERLHKGPELEDVRSMMEQAECSTRLPSGATVFVYANHYNVVRQAVASRKLRHQHVIVTEAFAPLVLEAIHSLACRLKVRVRSMDIIAYMSADLQDGHDDAFVIEHTFLAGPPAPLRNPQSVSQSTTNHCPFNPRRRST